MRGTDGLREPWADCCRRDSARTLTAQRPDARSTPTQNSRDLSAGLGGRLKNEANLVSQLVKLEPRSLGCFMGADKYEL